MSADTALRGPPIRHGFMHLSAPVGSSEYDQWTALIRRDWITFCYRRAKELRLGGVFEALCVGIRDPNDTESESDAVTAEELATTSALDAGMGSALAQFFPTGSAASPKSSANVVPRDLAGAQWQAWLNLYGRHLITESELNALVLPVAARTRSQIKEPFTPPVAATKSADSGAAPTATAAAGAGADEKSVPAPGSSLGSGMHSYVSQNTALRRLKYYGLRCPHFARYEAAIRSHPNDTTANEKALTEYVDRVMAFWKAVLQEIWIGIWCRLRPAAVASTGGTTPAPAVTTAATVTAAPIGTGDTKTSSVVAASQPATPAEIVDAFWQEMAVLARVQPARVAGNLFVWLIAFQKIDPNAAPTSTADPAKSRDEAGCQCIIS